MKVRRNIGILPGIALVVCLASLAAPEIASADVVTDFVPTADGFTRIFGGDFVDTTGTRLTVSQSGGNANSIIFEFDLGSIAAGSTLDSAELRLVHDGNISNVIGPSVPIEAFVYAGDGNIDIADFSATGLNSGNFSVPIATTSDGDLVTFDFTDLTGIQSVIDGADLLTIRLESNNFGVIDFASSENANFDGPVLRLETSAVPEPSGIGAAFLLCALLLRRQRVS